MPKTVFIGCDPANGIPGTLIPAEFYNSVNNHRHTGLDEDGAGALDYAVDSGAANAYIIALAPALTSLVAGMPIFFKASAANTGAATLNVCGLGAKSILKKGSPDLAIGDIQSGMICCVIFDGTAFQLLNPAKSTLSYLSRQSSGLTLSSSNWEDLTTLSLDAGEWDIAASFNFQNLPVLSGYWTASAVVSKYSGTSINDHNSNENMQYFSIPTATSTNLANMPIVIPRWRVSLTAAATIYLKARAIAGCQVTGFVNARLVG